MHTQKKELDRTFFKTHQSRSVKFSSNMNTGFTLIELLVVISIITLLSTVVLAVMQDGRVKARNTAKNSLVLEYVKALELYRSDNSSYPSAGAGNEVSQKCIGYEQSETCYLGFYTGSNTVNSAFSNYMGGSFAERTPILVGIQNLNGVRYKCTDSTCSSYQLFWVLENQNTNCISNATKANISIHTSCTYSQ